MSCRYPSFAPLGYINVDCNGKRFIQPDPVIGPQVRQLFEWYATGNYSLLEVTRKSYEESFVFRQSNHKIPKSVVHEILKNPLCITASSAGPANYTGVPMNS